MSDLADRLNNQLNYLYEMMDKYQVLNRQTDHKYSWRIMAIQTEIETLESLREGRKLDWDRCYCEDLRESNR